MISKSSVQTGSYRFMCPFHHHAECKLIKAIKEAENETNSANARACTKAILDADNSCELDGCCHHMFITRPQPNEDPSKLIQQGILKSDELFLDFASHYPTDDFKNASTLLHIRNHLQDCHGLTQLEVGSHCPLIKYQRIKKKAKSNKKSAKSKKNKK